MICILCHSPHVSSWKQEGTMIHYCRNCQNSFSNPQAAAMTTKIKPTTNIRCKKCGNGKLGEKNHVLCGFVNGDIIIHCQKCKSITESGPNAVFIRPLKKLPKDANWLNTFYGPWEKDEFETVEGVVRDIVRHNECNGDWRFFKGRAVYTAWLNGWSLERVLSAPTLCSLLDMVERKCVASR